MLSVHNQRLSQFRYASFSCAIIGGSVLISHWGETSDLHAANSSLALVRCCFGVAGLLAWILLFNDFYTPFVTVTAYSNLRDPQTHGATSARGGPDACTSRRTGAAGYLRLSGRQDARGRRADFRAHLPAAAARLLDGDQLRHAAAGEQGT